jgi:hypothetical protein
MGGPDLADQASHDDDAVGEPDHRVIDFGLAFGADQQFLEAAIVPGAGSFNDPTGSGLQWFIAGADDSFASEFDEQGTGFELS